MLIFYSLWINLLIAIGAVYLTESHVKWNNGIWWSFQLQLISPVRRFALSSLFNVIAQFPFLHLPFKMLYPAGFHEKNISPPYLSNKNLEQFYKWHQDICRGCWERRGITGVWNLCLCQIFPFLAILFKAILYHTSFQLSPKIVGGDKRFMNPSIMQL